MKKFINLIFLSSFFVFFLSGCAHKIDISPKMDDIRAVEIIPQNLIVGYFISEEDLNKEVVTAGGGGDMVKYTPYKDTEAVLNTVLSKNFKKVYYVKSLNDSKFVEDKNISYIFVPKIQTTSSSPSLFTWPPTKFTFELTTTATQIQPKAIFLETTISSTGNAEYEEFIKDFGLSAKRATEQTFMKTQYEIANKFNQKGQK